MTSHQPRRGFSAPPPLPACILTAPLRTGVQLPLLLGRRGLGRGGRSFVPGRIHWSSEKRGTRSSSLSSFPSVPRLVVPNAELSRSSRSEDDKRNSEEFRPSGFFAIDRAGFVGVGRRCRISCTLADAHGSSGPVLPPTGAQRAPCALSSAAIPESGPATSNAAPSCWTWMLGSAPRARRQRTASTRPRLTA